MALEGIDVSNHQPNINWDTVQGAGISFAFIKATEGTTFVDPQFTRNRNACRERGIIRSPYHFYRHDFDPTLQAAHFVNTIGTAESGDLPPTVDMEQPGDGAGAITYSIAEVINRFQTFLDFVKVATRSDCIIYTYPSAWKTVTGNSTAFSATNPLWIASYVQGNPTLVGGWPTYTFWQYTSTGHVAGINQIVDRNRFNGTLEELEAIAHVEKPSKVLFFEETQHSVRTGFLDFFMANGNVRIFGFPITEEQAGVNGDWSGTVQWFERACMEWHTEAGPGVVMLRNLGRELAPQ